MPRSRQSTTSRKKTSSNPAATSASRSPLLGIFEAAYQAGTFVAVAARRFVVGTVRAAESIAAEAAERAHGSAPETAVKVRKPPQKVETRARTVRRRRRAS
jgi:hypothetical protein